MTEPKRKIILYTALSLDGFIAGEQDEMDWLFSDQDYGYGEFYSSIDTVLCGNTTFTVASSFGEYPFPGKTAYIFTRKSGQSGEAEGLYFINEDPVLFVQRILQEKGKNIWLVGGGQINGLLLNAGLIDEMVLSYHPVFLGKGKALFQGQNIPAEFSTESVRQFASGLVQMHLTRKKETRQ